MVRARADRHRSALRLPLEVQVRVEAVLFLDHAQLIALHILTELTSAANHTNTLLLENLQALGSLLADPGLQFKRFRISSESHVAYFSLHIFIGGSRYFQEICVWRCFLNRAPFL